ncbi:MAG: hypothetical protein IPJ65_37860 [Archangiaceae bacterium]|nr:hypothetical protein [Archangiaceae bacterium]
MLCSLVFASAAGAAETDPEPTDDVVAPKQKAAAVEAAPAPAAGADAPAEAGFVRDRVRSVAPAFSKRGRVALTALGSVSINDAFFTNLAAGLAVHGYLRERLAVGVRGGYLGTLVDDDARIARANLQSAVLATHPVWHALAEVEWSPFYGKLAAGDSILYLDAFITSGLGRWACPGPASRSSSGVACGWPSPSGWRCR